jgi:hypothetical protein
MIGLSFTDGWFERQITFFTFSKWSHCFITLYPVGTEPTVLEADADVSVVPWSREYGTARDEAFDLWRIKDGLVDPALMAQVLQQVFHDFSEVQYGILQYPWFIWWWFNKKYLNRDISNQKNWFTKWIICSEIIYWYFTYLGDPFKSLVAQYSGDTMQPQNVQDILSAHPELFEKVATKQVGEVVTTWLIS